MKNLLLMAIMAALVTACGHTMVAPAPWSPRTTTSTTTILLSEKKISGEICVKKTKTRVQNCRKHRNNESCNIPGDTVIWDWKKNTDGSSSNDINRPFKITMKTGFSNPFAAGGNCASQANQVTCVINSGTTVNTFYDYNVSVDTSTTPLADCNLDPRFLIY